MPPTKLQRLSDKENHVSGHRELLQQRWGDRQIEGEQSLYPPFLSCSGHNLCKYNFPVRNIRDREQNPEWCWYAEKSRVRWSRRTIQQSALPDSSVEIWPITPKINAVYSRVSSYNTCLTCDLWLSKSARIHQTKSPSSSDWLHACLLDRLLERRCICGRILPLPDSRRTWINLSRAPLEAKRTRVWVHPKGMKLECRRAQRGVCFLREWCATGAMGAHQEMRRQRAKTKRRESA